MSYRLSSFATLHNLATFGLLAGGYQGSSGYVWTHETLSYPIMVKKQRATMSYQLTSLATIHKMATFGPLGGGYQGS